MSSLNRRERSIARDWSVFALNCLLSLAAVLSAPAAQAALHDRGNGMIYDDHLNVTFLANANYAKVQGLGVNGSGRMTLAQARQFADQLVYAGYDDWRLPTGAWCGAQWSPGCGGELNHLIHVEIRPTLMPSLQNQQVPIFCSPIVRTESGDDNHLQGAWGSWNECANTFSNQPGGMIGPDAAAIFTVPNCNSQQEGNCWFWTEAPVPNPGTPPVRVDNQDVQTTFAAVSSGDSRNTAQ